jgi:hypothetical protein
MGHQSPGPVKRRGLVKRAGAAWTPGPACPARTAAYGQATDADGDGNIWTEEMEIETCGLHQAAYGQVTDAAAVRRTGGALHPLAAASMPRSRPAAAAPKPFIGRRLYAPSGRLGLTSRRGCCFATLRPGPRRRVPGVCNRTPIGPRRRIQGDSGAGACRHAGALLAAAYALCRPLSASLSLSQPLSASVSL